MRFTKYILTICIATITATTLTAQETVPSSEIVHQLHGLANNTKVLYIAAHPDDENTRLISYLTNYTHAEVSYLSLTRGDGGQNLIGTEIGEQLGLIRTQELLAARRIDGANQYFTRAIDFGYSKTPEETFRFWEKSEILSDVVWVIRKVQPDVIITRFSPEVNPERSTHGHHTASAMLALEAFDLAADPTQFPEQLDKVKPWQTKSIFWNTSYWFYGSVERMDEEVAKTPNAYVKFDVNKYLPLIGKSGSDISSLSRSQHKSQGFGNSPVIGSQWEYLQILKGEIADNMFASTFKDKGLNAKLDKQIQKAIKSFNIEEPHQIIPLLFEIRNNIAQLDKTTSRGDKLEAVHKIILSCAGIKATAFTNEQQVFVGQNVESKISISSATPIRINTITSNWRNGDVNIPINTTNTYFNSPLTWTIPINSNSQPYWLQGDKQTGIYQVTDQDQIGLAENRYPFMLSISMDIAGEPIAMNVPLLHGSTDPVKGKRIQPLIVTPAAMLNIGRQVMVYTSNKAKVVDVEVIAGKANVNGYVEIFVPDGWKSEPAFYKTSLTHKGDKKLFQFTITPSNNESEGTLRAIFKDDKLVYSMGIYQLKYDHIPELAVFPSASSKVVRVDLKKEGQHVGYLMGAGDKVPEAIEEMGYEVTQLSVDDILQKDLSKYDAVVLGIRALNTIGNVGSLNEVLSNYVKSGGKVVMQYNTAHRLKAQPIGPYTIKLSRDRVTEEDAEVKIINAEHPVLKSPNVITEKDFKGWVQERGLYFPNEWDKEMKSIFSMHDNGETGKLGSLLIGQHGNGYIVYTGLSFFRELPAGVPGAYRIIANILSL
ncbi:MAG: PIG-L family deacetylase [Bacteroidetes bacterium]|nr:PIG-L family deacetylase [Bacteroidota bacterium]